MFPFLLLNKIVVAVKVVENVENMQFNRSEPQSNVCEQVLHKVVESKLFFHSENRTINLSTELINWLTQLLRKSNTFFTHFLHI